MNISKHFTLDQAIKSDTATRHKINNMPNDTQIESIKLVASRILDDLIDKGYNIRISSFYRSQALNSRVGGSSTSQHTKGEAVDIVGSNLSEVFKYIKDTLTFDQLIWEFGTSKAPDWIHVSLKKTGNRKQVLKATKLKGKTLYLPYTE